MPLDGRVRRPFAFARGSGHGLAPTRNLAYALVTAAICGPAQGPSTTGVPQTGLPELSGRVTVDIVPEGGAARHARDVWGLPTVAGSDVNRQP